MSTTPPKDRRAGMASFGDDDDLPIPTPAQIAAAKSRGEGLGFKSEKATAPVPAEKARIGGNGRPAVFTANFHIRTRPEDRERFEEFAYRQRVSKGEAMRRLLDFWEEREAAETNKRDI